MNAMSIMTPFEEAHAALGLGAVEGDPGTLKRAYRRAVVEHPPDRDPEGFRRARDAYELLCDPGSRARELLLSPVPMAPPPALPEAPPRAGAAAVAVLRLVAGQIDPETWFAGKVAP